MLDGVACDREVISNRISWSLNRILEGNKCGFEDIDFLRALQLSGLHR